MFGGRGGWARLSVVVALVLLGCGGEAKPDGKAEAKDQTKEETPSESEAEARAKAKEGGGDGVADAGGAKAEGAPPDGAGEAGADGGGGISKTVDAVRTEKKIKAAKALMEQDKLAEAASLLEALMASEPEQPDAIAMLGQIRVLQERWKDAEPLLKKHAEANDKDKGRWIALAEARAELDDPKGAAEAYGKASALDPDDAELALRYGRAVLDGGDAAKAVVLFQAAADIDPMVMYVETAIGDAQYAQGKYKDALKSYMKAQSKYASDKMARAGAALTYEAMGDNKHAVDEWSAYIRMDCCSDYSNDVAKPKLMDLAK